MATEPGRRPPAYGGAHWGKILDGLSWVRLTFAYLPTFVTAWKNLGLRDEDLQALEHELLRRPECREGDFRHRRPPQAAVRAAAIRASQERRCARGVRALPRLRVRLGLHGVRKERQGESRCER